MAFFHFKYVFFKMRILAATWKMEEIVGGTVSV
jgi:hypothetical protein